MATNSLLRPCIQTLILYLFLILTLRVLGRRQMGQLTVLDLVILILLGSAVETAMIAGDTSLTAGLVSAATLLVANRALTRIVCRSRRLRRLIVGSPILLVHNGHFIEEHLKKAGLVDADVLEAIRERGYSGPEELMFAVMEIDGSINAVPFDALVQRGRHDLRSMTGSTEGGRDAGEVVA
jgi:uncharacterized membrane protein YcaP (DUF421 family)